jgi:RND family efflux transporter MFP subunit
MKLSACRISLLVIALVIGAASAGWMPFGQSTSLAQEKNNRPNAAPVPVEVTDIEHGPIALQRIFSGELEAPAQFVVAPKVGGRVERMLVDIADTVQRGQVVAELDNAEYIQIVAQAQADLAVAQANISEAKSAVQIAEREYKRTESLLSRGIASDSDYDKVKQDMLVKQAQLKVAEAQVQKAQSSLAEANIRLGYTVVNAGWTGGDEYRVVAERYVDEGQTVTANSPLLLIVELDPIVGIVNVTERDYARLKPGQVATLTTDAFPGEQFTGRIERIAPIFRKSTRQARIEMIFDNPQYRLKPGMFISARVVLEQLSEAIIVPEQALTKRNDKTGVFIVTEDGRSVVWREVEVGFRDNGRVQVTGEGLSGRVVTLGQQMVNDGSLITIPADLNHDAESHAK